MNPGGDTPQSSLPNERLITVPISRAAPGTFSEKPERARTTHACEPCRERKTKCDGERPSCRRCLHTGTSCHYGHGKGWRKRKIAEDLTETSRRLERYEDLLTDILPMVNSQVKTMIKEARDAENDAFPVLDSAESELQSSGSQPSDRSRLPPLPLPVPSPMLRHTARTPSLSFDPISDPSSSGSNSHRHSLPRPSEDPATKVNRLPSIRPDGMLIDSLDLHPTEPRITFRASESPSVPNLKGDLTDDLPPPGGDPMIL